MPINRLVFRQLSNQICRCQHRCRPNSIRKRRDAYAQTVANFHSRRSSSCRIRREGWFLCGRFSFINKKMADKKPESQFYTRPPQLGKWESLRVFLWNSETKQFLGRTGGSWSKYPQAFQSIHSA